MCVAVVDLEVDDDCATHLRHAQFGPPFPFKGVLEWGVGRPHCRAADLHRDAFLPAVNGGVSR